MNFCFVSPFVVLFLFYFCLLYCFAYLCERGASECQMICHENVYALFIMALINFYRLVFAICRAIAGLANDGTATMS